MKYILIFAYMSSFVGGGNTCYSSNALGGSDTKWICDSPAISSNAAPQLYDSKDDCMAALKKLNDPTIGYCVAANGFSRELKPY